jgi:membrane-associated phospholipid phosphatase
MMGQKDTSSLPTMTSKNLITLDDYNPDAVYGASYREMMKSRGKETGKTPFNRQGSKFILPTLFIVYGVSARFNQLPVRRLDFDIKHEINKRIDRQYNIDDYFEYGLPVAAYGLGFIPGVGKRNFRDRTLAMATSFLFMEGSVKLLKEVVPVKRPYGDDRSFPSGHTAVTMMSAHFMYKEYKDCSPWIGVSGYMVAAATGVLRMLNDAHWFSDVMMGAGIGILSTEIGYMALPVWHSIFGIKDGERRFVAVPAFSTQGLGLGLVYQF